MPNTLQNRLYTLLEKSPWGPALAHISYDGDFSWRSLEDVYKQAVGYGARLSDLGLGPGDTCILVLPSDEFCAAMLTSTLFLGAVPLLVAPPTIQGRGRYSSLAQVLNGVIAKTKPRVVIAPEAMIEIREDLKKADDSTQFVFGADSLNPDTSATLRVAGPQGTDVAALQLTSGTTGFPRVCIWKQENIIAALDGMEVAMDLNKDDICLNWTPLYHDMGFVNNFLLCLTKGIPLAMLSPTEFVKKPALWLRGLFHTGSTITWSPNFGFAITANRVRDDEIEGVRLDRVRAFWNAAEKVHLETIQAFHERFEPFGLQRDALKTNYGLAENVGGATFSDPHGPLVIEEIDQLILQQKGIAHPVTEPSDGQRTAPVVGVGRPHPEIEVKILSQDGRALPEGHVGEIALKTPSRMSGYLGDADETHRALYGDLLRTGDMGYVRDNQLFWMGRVRERITTMGKKVDPSYFEHILLNIPDLRQGCFAAFGVDDTKIGTQRIVIITEVQDNISRPYGDIISDIRGQVQAQLGLRADDVLLVPQNTLTKTSSGKRRHRHFRQLYLNGELQSLALS